MRISPVCATRSAAGRKKRAKRRQRSAFPPPAIHPPRRRRRRGACPRRAPLGRPRPLRLHISGRAAGRGGSEGSAAAGHGQGHSAAIASRRGQATRHGRASGVRRRRKGAIHGNALAGTVHGRGGATRGGRPLHARRGRLQRRSAARLEGHRIKRVLCGVPARTSPTAVRLKESRGGAADVRALGGARRGAALQKTAPLYTGLLCMAMLPWQCSAPASWARGGRGRPGATKSTVRNSDSLLTHCAAGSRAPPGAAAGP